MERLLAIAGVALIAWLALGSGERDVASPEPPSPPKASVPNIPAPPPRAGNGFARHTLARAPDGHFYADARINGARAEMMVDTGASVVVLSRADARAAGVRLSRNGFTARAQTAGGEIALHPVVIGRLAIGPLVARDVPAMVAEEDVPVSLLGQSFLSRVENVEIRGDEMRMR